MENIQPANNNQSCPPAKRQRVDHQFERWARPAIKLGTEPGLTFMQVDIDSYTQSAKQNNLQTSVPVLRMYGVTEDGNSVLAHIHGFQPYFYVPCPDDFQDCEILKGSLETQLGQAGVRDKVTPFVLNVEIVQRSSLMYYQESGLKPFFKVVVAIPSLVSMSRNIIERGFSLSAGGQFAPSTSFETNIPFPLRYMVDRGIAGGSWIQIDGGYEIRKGLSHTSTCQIELDVHYERVVNIEKIQLAPMRIFSFDIECYNPERKGFPTAQKCPVIQIAVYLKEQGAEDKLVHCIWSLRSCNEIAGAHVFAFESEADLLMSFRDFIEVTDPDILTGYNIVGFDLPYLIDRAETLGVANFSKLGRLREKARMRTNNVQGRDVIDITIDGRVQFDMLAVIQKEQKLCSYSLNAVSAEFLGEQKEDVHYSQIGELFEANADTRRRLAVYCLKDAYLPVKLMEKLLCMYNYVEMARVTGTPINFLLNRGQMIKVVSMLLRKARELNFVMPTTRSQPSDEKFEGATVLDPLCGYYDKPITTLDFASLYPSIMMAHNLCYSTLVQPDNVAKFKPEELTKSPIGCHFLKAEGRKGMLPMILQELLAARKKAKKDMAAATDPLTKSVLNGRQLALKVSANSVYGFTGATVGMLPCLEISSSVTAFGRQMIDHTKKLVEEKYNIANGYAHDSLCIYGDTDSVFIKFGVDTVAESMKLGEEAADMVSATFIKPIKLEFEKVYFPYLLMNKKRYAGLYWTNPDKYDYLDAKGIETVRRDNCGLARTLVQTTLNKILIDRSPSDAIEYVKGVIADLLTNKIDLSLLVISKSLGKGCNAEDYAMKLAHVELAEKLKKRDPSTAPGTGDRVPYVILQAAKGTPAWARSEDPLYALENNLSIDAQYYIEHQLEQPLLRIFDPIMKNARSQLFNGDHTRKKVNATPSMGALSAFVKKGVRCLGCKAIIKEGSLCTHCKEDKAPQIIMEKVKDLREKESLYNRLWTQCQRCQGSLMEPVICSNRDCEIFYRRAKARKDVQAVQECMNRLNLDASW